MSTQAISERDQALDDFIQALGRLFSAEVSHLEPQAAIMVCEAIQHHGAKVQVRVELAPLKLSCELNRGDVSVPLFEVAGGYEQFGFATLDANAN
jgi:hypothetical protein